MTRNFLSIGFNSFVHILLSLRMNDTQAGFKVFRRSALQKILPLISVKRYAFDVELLVVATKICQLQGGGIARQRRPAIWLSLEEYYQNDGRFVRHRVPIED